MNVMNICTAYSGAFVHSCIGDSASSRTPRVIRRRKSGTQVPPRTYLLIRLYEYQKKVVAKVNLLCLSSSGEYQEETRTIEHPDLKTRRFRKQVKVLSTRLESKFEKNFF